MKIMLQKCQIVKNQQKQTNGEKNKSQTQRKWDPERFSNVALPECSNILDVENYETLKSSKYLFPLFKNILKSPSKAMKVEAKFVNTF